MKKAKANTRYYLEDGTLVPGVTTVLGLLNKPALVKWANRQGLNGIDIDKYVSELASIGTLAHVMITDRLVGKQTDTSDFTANQIDTAENSVLSFFEWEKQNKIQEVYWVEKPLVSERYRFGGTADIYCRINDKREQIDLKTGTGIYPEHKYQVATLSVLMDENDFPTDGARVLNIPRSEDESFAEHVLTPFQMLNGWLTFYHLLQADTYIKKMKGVKKWKKKP